MRTDLKTGQIEVLTDRFEGKRYNSPNDVVVDIQGCIWFTDPYYGEDRSTLEMDAEAVYRIDPDGNVTRVLSQPQIERPNGLAITPDGRTLYVIDSHTRPGRQSQGLGVRRRRGRRASAASAWSSTSAGAAAATACGSTSRATSGSPPASCSPATRARRPTCRRASTSSRPTGELLGRIPIPEDLCTNLAFGGPDRKTLYVTSGKTVYKVPLAVSGYALYPPKKG